MPSRPLGHRRHRFQSLWRTRSRCRGIAEGHCDDTHPACGLQCSVALDWLAIVDRGASYLDMGSVQLGSAGAATVSPRCLGAIDRADIDGAEFGMLVLRHVARWGHWCTGNSHCWRSLSRPDRRRAGGSRPDLCRTCKLENIRLKFCIAGNSERIQGGLIRRTPDLGDRALPFAPLHGLKDRSIVVDSRRNRAKSEPRKFPFEIISEKF